MLLATLCPARGRPDPAQSPARTGARDRRSGVRRRLRRAGRMTDPRSWTPVPLARGARGAVVAPHHLATAAGSSILRAGGSAVDAAIATNAVLGVVMPNGCGIGGDAFWLIWDAATGQQLALNGSGRAPAGSRAAKPSGRRHADDPARRGARDHGARRGPIVGRGPPALRPAVARRDPGPRDRASPERVSRPGTASSTRSRRRPRWSPKGSGPTPGSSPSTGRTAGRGDPASGSACRPSPRPSRRSPARASMRSTTATSRRGRPGRLLPPALRSGRRTSRHTGPPGTSRSRSTTGASG